MKNLTFNQMVRDMNAMQKNICKVHPTYKAIRPPTTAKDCDCHKIYAKALEGKNVKKTETH